jgi:hypothetical protein
MNSPMKNIYRVDLILIGIFYLAVLVFMTSCEQEEAVVELNTAPGGGTVTTYKAYTVDAVTEEDVYGRIVFYKDNADNTLVQVSLYNTEEGIDYTTKLFDGAVEVESPTSLMTLYTVNGTTGEFAPAKFYVIGDKDFYDNLPELDAHLKIMSGDLLMAAGNVGKNAAPVAEGE